MVPVQNELPQKKALFKHARVSVKVDRSIDDDDDYDDRLKTFQNATKHATFYKRSPSKTAFTVLTSVYLRHRSVRFIVI